MGFVGEYHRGEVPSLLLCQGAPDIYLHHIVSDVSQEEFNGGNCFTGRSACAQCVWRLEKSPGGLTGRALARE